MPDALADGSAANPAPAAVRDALGNKPAVLTGTKRHALTCPDQASGTAWVTPEVVLVGTVATVPGSVTVAGCAFAPTGSTFTECGSNTQVSPRPAAIVGAGGAMFTCVDASEVVGVSWVAVPKGTAWVAQDRTTHWLVYPATTSLVPLASPGSDSSHVTHYVRYLDASGQVLGNDVVSGAIAG